MASITLVPERMQIQIYSNRVPNDSSICGRYLIISAIANDDFCSFELFCTCRGGRCLQLATESVYIVQAGVLAWRRMFIFTKLNA